MRVNDYNFKQAAVWFNDQLWGISDYCHQLSGQGNRRLEADSQIHSTRSSTRAAGTVYLDS